MSNVKERSYPFGQKLFRCDQIKYTTRDLPSPCSGHWDRGRAQYKGGDGLKVISPGRGKSPGLHGEERIESEIGRRSEGFFPQ